MRAVIGRVVGAAVAALVVALASNGIDITPETQSLLTQGLTAIGMAFGLIAYALVHKLVNRFTDPADTT